MGSNKTAIKSASDIREYLIHIGKGSGEVEVAAVVVSAAGVAAGKNEHSHYETGIAMAARKKSTKKTGSKEQASAKKTPAKRAVTKKSAGKSGPSKKPSGKLSALDAAAKVLAESKQPMNARQMIEQMAAKGYWRSPGGQTPSATLYAAIIREVQKKGKESRFKKTDRGLFALNR